MTLEERVEALEARLADLEVILLEQAGRGTPSLREQSERWTERLRGNAGEGA